MNLDRRLRAFSVRHPVVTVTRLLPISATRSHPGYLLVQSAASLARLLDLPPLQKEIILVHKEF
jgi:hypothetical protein